MVEERRERKPTVTLMKVKETGVLISGCKAGACLSLCGKDLEMEVEVRGFTQHVLTWSNQGLAWNGCHLPFPGERGNRDRPKKLPVQIPLTLFGHHGMR